MEFKDYEGKTIESIVNGESYCVIHFTDGTYLFIAARGGDDFLWIDIEKGG